MAGPIARRSAGSRPRSAPADAADQHDGGGTEWRRGGGPQRLRPRLTRLLDPVARQRGLVDGALLTEWARIVGPDLAKRCRPVKVARARGGGVLAIRAPGAAAIELQHAAPQIVQRINDYFGFVAVRRLKLVQAPVPTPEAPPAAAEISLTTEQRQAIEAMVKDVVSSPLREALFQLGNSLWTRPADSDK